MGSCDCRRKCQLGRRYSEAEAAKERLWQIRTQQAELVRSQVQQRHLAEQDFVRTSMLSRRKKHQDNCSQCMLSPPYINPWHIAFCITWRRITWRRINDPPQGLQCPEIHFWRRKLANPFSSSIEEVASGGPKSTCLTRGACSGQDT